MIEPALIKYTAKTDNWSKVTILYKIHSKEFGYKQTAMVRK